MLQFGTYFNHTDLICQERDCQWDEIIAIEGRWFCSGIIESSCVATAVSGDSSVLYRWGIRSFFWASCSFHLACGLTSRFDKSQWHYISKRIIRFRYESMTWVRIEETCLETRSATENLFGNWKGAAVSTLSEESGLLWLFGGICSTKIRSVNQTNRIGKIGSSPSDTVYSIGNRLANRQNTINSTATTTSEFHEKRPVGLHANQQYITFNIWNWLLLDTWIKDCSKEWFYKWQWSIIHSPLKHFWWSFGLDK